MRRLSFVLSLALFFSILVACEKKEEEQTTLDFPESVCSYEFNSLDPKGQEVPEEIITLVNEKLATLTLEEKAGQMVQPERNGISIEEVREYNIGSILSGGGSVPYTGNTPKDWIDMYNAFQSAALESSSGIPIIYGVDAVHGHNNVYGATIFPHNIGLGAANDPELMYRIGEATAEEIKITGLDWNFAPAVSVAQDIRWGRIYESFGECPGLQTSLTQRYIEGLQEHNISATAKHFLADGGTQWDPSKNAGQSNPDAYRIDTGDAKGELEAIKLIHLQGYIEALNAGVDTVMISHSSINGTKMHGNQSLVQTLLKDDLGFNGFVISDYESIHQLPGDFKTQVKSAINAGVDMLMEPYQWKETIEAIIDNVNEGEISMERIDDAVGRILTIKYKQGLFDSPIKTFDDTQFNSEEHKAIAREAVRKSLVLLKNEKELLPLDKHSNILLLGPGSDHVGLQSGGWTIDWQGTTDKGRVKGTSILQAMKSVLEPNGGNVYTGINNRDKADVAVVVLSEIPYAEGVGDNGDLTLSSHTASSANSMALTLARRSGLPVVVILLSGRPLIVTEEISEWDAFVAAWLPGSEGGNGISDVLFGDYDFTGKLPVTWPKSRDQISETVNKENYIEEEYLFPYGFGLSYGD